MLNASVGSTGKELTLNWSSVLRVRTRIVRNENACNPYPDCFLFKKARLLFDLQVPRGMLKSL